MRPSVGRSAGPLADPPEASSSRREYETVHEGRQRSATTIRAIAGAAGGVCAAATTVRPATPNSAGAAARRMASENRSGLTDISQVGAACRKFAAWL